MMRWHFVEHEAAQSDPSGALEASLLIVLKEIRHFKESENLFSCRKFLRHFKASNNNKTRCFKALMVCRMKIRGSLAANCFGTLEHNSCSF